MSNGLLIINKMSFNIRNLKTTKPPKNIFSVNIEKYKMLFFFFFFKFDINHVISSHSHLLLPPLLVPATFLG